MTSRSVFKVALLGAVAVAAQAEDSDFCAAIEGRVQAILEEHSPAIVRVEATDRHGKLSGTGFFADPMGTIYTVYSTVGDSRDVWVMVGDERLPATVLLSDKRSGVALLKVERTTPFLPLAGENRTKVASPVVTIGFPRDLEISPSFGIVAGFDRKCDGRYFVTTHIRASVPVQPGMGGAPLLNLRGEVVGMVIASADGSAGCFALPIEAAEKIRLNFVRFGEARHGWVGITVEGIPGEPVRVAELGPDTPASQSGIREGDTLLSVGSTAIDEVEDVLDASYFLTEGDPIDIRILRGGQELLFSVSSAAHPDAKEPGDLQTVSAPTGFNLQGR